MVLNRERERERAHMVTDNQGGMNEERMCAVLYN